MKILRLLILSLGFAAALHAKYVPTPEKAMSFAMGNDPTKWVAQFMDGNETGIIFELVPQGDDINSWKEMVAQQIAFTNAPLSRYVEVWRSGMLRADPKMDLKIERADDGSVTATYTSLAAQEMSIRRFIKAEDGIYMLAYHVRPALKNESRLKLWRQIIGAASLIPNPQKGR